MPAAAAATLAAMELAAPSGCLLPSAPGCREEEADGVATGSSPHREGLAPADGATAAAAGEFGAMLAGGGGASIDVPSEDEDASAGPGGGGGFGAVACGSPLAFASCVSECLSSWRILSIVS